MAQVHNKKSKDNRRGKVIPLQKAINKGPRGRVKDQSSREAATGSPVAPWRRQQGQDTAREPFWPQGGSQTLMVVAFAGLLLLLFYPPFFRGLFFPVEQRWTLMLAAILFFLTYLWKLSRRETAFLTRPLDFAAAALVAIYILAAIKPASRGLAMAEVAKIALYFLTFWLTSRLAGQRRTIYIIHALYLAAVGAALAALLTATGLVNIKDGFVGGRFYSTLQYPNALASYVGAGAILGFYLWARASNPWRYPYAAANYLLLMVFLGTGSRGAYLIFPIIVFLYWLLTPGGYRLNTLAHLLVSAAAALVGMVRFIPLATAKAYGPAWGWFALGLALTLVGQLLIQGAGRVLITPRARVAAGVAVLVVLVGTGAFFIQHQLAVTPASSGGQATNIVTRILPSQIRARIQDINLETKSSRERLLWTGDALKMIRERPILGFGGGGWEAAYRQYQSYFYNSTQVHNDYAQVAVETGLLGLGVLALIWLLFLLATAGNYRHSRGPERLQALAIGIAALNLGLHAAIDFDLALGAVSIMLWACFGLSRALEGQRLGPEPVLPVNVFKNQQLAWTTAAAIATLVLILFAGSYLAGVASARQAAAALQRQNIAATTAYLEEASRYDPFTASYNSDLAGIYLQQGKTKEALAMALAASAKDPYNLAVLNRLAEVYWQEGAVDQAVATMERARQLAPWAGAGWENLGQAYDAAGVRYLQTGQRDKARQMFQLAAALPGAVEAKVNTLGEFKDLHQPGGVALTPAIQLRAGIAQYFLGQEQEAAGNLAAAAKDGQLQAEANLWQAVLAFHQGDNVRAGQLLAGVQKANANLAKQYDQLKNLPVLGS
ncbi:O-antigen ligase family protein [Moorella naiadis]|uniref:O-antigen ligase family protein n=1 Tax=Moorella naiadis (nom. illeg.) TaxID=3093670 RepID=UPI003D9CB37F